MATSPLSNIYFPSDELLNPQKSGSFLCAAVSTLAAHGGSATDKTITIGNEYPPIDQEIPNPVLAIFAVQDGATMVANGAQAWDISNQCDGTPDSADEFQVTGARTISVYQEANESMVVLVIYVAKGTGNKR